MATVKSEAAQTEPGPEPPEEVTGELALSQWEFIGVPPTQEDVLRLLGTLPQVWGVETIEFADYVQALPQKKKVQKPHPTNPNLMVAESVEAWVLYMSVAGRVKMLERAQMENDWCVDTEPDLIDNGRESGRIVYRETVRIGNAVMNRDSDLVVIPIGSRTGTAWVPFSGGSNAAGSNPYEKVETSARGRAIGAWGFGVFPGSGIATLEEMQAIASNQRAMDAEQPAGGRRGGAARPTRDELMTRLLTRMEEFRQVRGVSEEQMLDEMARYLSSIGVRDVMAEGKIDWDKVRDGQLQLAVNKISQHLQEIVAQEWSSP